LAAFAPRSETLFVQSTAKSRVHIHLPAGGQGINMGMQDALNLG